MMVIFPFEEKFYRTATWMPHFIGHPLAELPMPTISRGRVRRGPMALDPAKQWIALLPGSR